MTTAGKSLDHTEVVDLMESFGTLPRTRLTWYVAATGGNDWKAYPDMLLPGGPAYADRL